MTYGSALPPLNPPPRKARWFALGCAFGILLGFILGAVGASNSDGIPVITATSAPLPTVQAPRMGPVTLTGPGVYLVGTKDGQAKPGVWSAPAVPGTNCYWERLSGTTGSLDAIKANGLLKGGPGVVTVEEDDVAFGLRGACTWTHQ